MVQIRLSSSYFDTLEQVIDIRMKPETEIGDRGLEHGVSYKVRGRVKRRYAQIVGEENWSI